jgi:aminoglycoside phosphotransferase (APT) family kinase protein
VEDWYEWARQSRGFPTVGRAIRYLRDNQPADALIGVSWGDSRPGNIIFNPADQTVASILDWELASLGPPETDLAWWLMFERVFTHMVPVNPPEGVPDRSETIATYEQFLGHPVGDMHYYDVLAWSRFAVTAIRHVDLAIGTDEEAMMRDLIAFVHQALADELSD